MSDAVCPCALRSGGFYARNEGAAWIPTMLLTANLFPLLCFGIASVLNTIAISYHSLAAVPFGSIVVVLLIWLFLSFPLCLLGTVCAPLPPGRPCPSAVGCMCSSHSPNMTATPDLLLTSLTQPNACNAFPCWALVQHKLPTRKLQGREIHRLC